MAGISAFACPAFAQQGQPTPSTAVAEVVVTATKRGSESLQKVPIAITALSQATLEAKGAEDFVDFARSVPSLSFVDGGPGQKTYIIRGVNSTGTGVATVGQYIDDILITGDLRQPDLRLYDVQRIEVLRGPQGTLYGSGSLSGTIRTITNAPDVNRYSVDLLDRTSGTAHGGANYEGAATVNAPLIDGRLGLRITAYDDSESGFINNVRLGNTHVNDEHTYGTHTALKLVIDPATSLTGNFFYQSTNLGGRFIVVTADGDLGHYNTDQYVHDPFTDRFRIYNLTFKHGFGSADLTISSSYFDRGVDNNFDSTPYDLSFGPTFFTQVVGLSTPDANTDQFDTSRLLTNEIRLSSHFGGRIEGVVGLFQQQIKTTFTTLVATTTPQGYLKTPLEPVFGQHQAHETDQYALFGEVSYKITPKLTALVGARAFYAEESDDLNATHPFGGFAPPSVSPTIDSYAHKVTPKFYLSYQATPDALYYATVSQGFRIGGGNQNNITPLPREDQVYNPDSLWNYELGAKHSFFDRRLVVDVSAYLLEWSNIQVSDFTDDTNAFEFIANAGSAEVKGIDFEVEGKPTRYLDVGGTLSLVDAELTEDQPSTNAAFAGKNGDRFPNVPMVQGSAFVQYTHPITDAWEGFVRVDYSYTGRQGTQFSRTNPLYNTIAAYNLVNLRAGVRSGRYEITGYAKNLFNTYAATNILEEASDLTPRSIVPVRPLTAGLELRLHY